MELTNDSVSRFLSSVPKGSFVWGKFDCATFFCLCADFLTGFDYSAIIAGKWETKRQAMKFFLNFNFIEFIDEEFEYSTQTLASCRSGDLCVFKCGEMHTVGLVYDNQVVSVVENLGVTYTPLSEISDEIIKILRIIHG